MDEGYECSIFSFSLQYPGFLFPGKTQFTDEPAPPGIRIHSVINSVNPLNWISVGNKIKKMKPDLVIVRFWLPFMGPALGTILRKIHKNKHSRIVCIADNVIPHEKRPGDHAFTKYFLKAPDAFVTMSDKVMQDLRSFEKNKPAAVVTHPLYDNFGEAIPKTEARQQLGLPVNEKLILFFGFIRNYKGLDLLFRAMANEKIREAGIKLLVAGEFYEDEKKYESLIKELNIADQLILKTDFIPDSQVKYFLCAADLVVQPYRNATQSGVTPLAYHFEKPMIVTNVGGLPLLVPDGKVGLVVEPDPGSIAEGIIRFYEKGEETFIQNIKEEKKKYTWTKLVSNIIKLADINEASKP
jgi:glycosyltransferase involved in cell wall biosynthesis